MNSEVREQPQIEAAREAFEREFGRFACFQGANAPAGIDARNRIPRRWSELSNWQFDELRGSIVGIPLREIRRAVEAVKA